MEFKQFLDKLECQFLSCYPVYKMDWEEFSNHLTVRKQWDIIQRTFQHDLNLGRPINKDYQRHMLKQILKILHDKNNSTCEEFYELINELYDNSMGLNEYDRNKYIYRHFWLPTFEEFLTLCETKYIVYKGNTGLYTWQAALALADYILHNPSIVQGKNVIELGAGTGFLSLMALKCFQPKSIIITDGSEDSVDLIQKNFKYNFIYSKIVSENEYTLKKCTIGIYEMPWSDMKSDDRLEHFKPDVILASDVTFDDSIFDDLISAIEFLFEKSSNQAKLYLAATVRNEDTLNNFKKLIENSNFQINNLDNLPIESCYLHWDRSTPVSILLITRNQENKI